MNESAPKLDQLETGTPIESPLEYGIKSAETFEDLYATINAEGGVMGSKKNYSAEEIKIDVERIRSQMSALDKTFSHEQFDRFVSNKEFGPLNKITQRSGLQEKVRELLIRERVDRLAEQAK